MPVELFLAQLFLISQFLALDFIVYCINVFSVPFQFFFLVISSFFPYTFLNLKC